MQQASLSYQFLTTAGVSAPAPSSALRSGTIVPVHAATGALLQAGRCKRQQRAADKALASAITYCFHRHPRHEVQSPRARLWTPQWLSLFQPITSAGSCRWRQNHRPSRPRATMSHSGACASSCSNGQSCSAFNVVLRAQALTCWGRSCCTEHHIRTQRTMHDSPTSRVSREHGRPAGLQIREKTRFSVLVRMSAALV